MERVALTKQTKPVTLDVTSVTGRLDKKLLFMIVHSLFQKSHLAFQICAAMPIPVWSS